MLGVKKGGRDAHQDDIIELLRKYDEEKQLLVQENKQLEARIFKEIDENHKCRMGFEKREAEYKRRLEELERELLSCRSLQEANKQQTQEYQKLEKEYHDNLQGYSEALKLAKEKQETLDQLAALVNKKDAEQQRLAAINEELRNKLRAKEEEYELIRDQVGSLQHSLKSISLEREQLKDALSEHNQQLQIYEASLAELNGKYSNAKKRRKAAEAEISELTMRQNQSLSTKEEELNAMQSELASLESEKEKLTQSNIALSTKVEFLSLELNQKTSLIGSMESDHQRSLEAAQQKEAELTLKCTTFRAENERFERQIYEYHEQASRNQDQYRQAVLAYELTFKSMKDRILTQLMDQSRSSSSEQAIRRLEACMDSVKKMSEKDSKITKLKEKVQLLEEELKTIKENRHKTTGGAKSAKTLIVPSSTDATYFEKVRLENQLNCLEVEISLARKGQDQLKLENTILSDKLAEAREELNQKASQLAVMQADSGKLERFYVEEIKKCINQLQAYKERELVSSEISKEQKELKQIFALKVANYEKKVKELVDSVQRKEGIVEGLKGQKKQLQETLIKLQDRLNKLEEEAEIGRKMKADCARKDELMQQYKSKWESKKSDFEQAVGERDRLKRENDRLEKSLQRKGHYLQTMKAKHQRQLGDFEKKLKTNSTHTKSISHVMENKLMEMKKECVQYDEAFQRMATYMLQVIRQQRDARAGIPGRTRKSKSKRKVKLTEEQGSKEGSAVKSTKGWEAAKILGLKQSEIQQFLNPQPEPVPDCEQQLEQLWRKGLLIEFFEKAIDYLRSILTA